jgi:hypothetical protein
MNLKENDQIPNSEVFIFENNAPVKKNYMIYLKEKKQLYLDYLEPTPQFALQNIYQDTLIILINTKKKV